MASSGWVLVDDADPRIQYSPGWQAFVNGSEVDGTKHGAAAAGLTASLNFTGTQVAVVGSLGSVDVHGVPTSLYTLDGAEAGLYTAPVIAPGLFQLNVTFFSSKSLSPGEHTLVITNVNGTSPNVFWLDYVEYVPSAAASSSSTTTTSFSSSSQSPTTASHSLATSPTPTASDQEGSSSTPRNHAGAIAGGIVGGVALVLALAALLLVCLRRRRRGVANTSSDPCESQSISSYSYLATSTSTSTSRADSARPPACLVHSTASVRPFGSWRSPDSAEAQTPNQTDSPTSPPSQKQTMTTTMAGASTPTLSATLPTTPTHTRTGLPPVSRAGSGPTQRPSSGEPTRSRSGVAGRHSGSEPHVTQSVDSGLRLAGEAVTVLPPPYTRE